MSWTEEDIVRDHWT